MILLVLPLILYCYFCKYRRSRLEVRRTGKDPVHWLYRQLSQIWAHLRLHLRVPAVVLSPTVLFSWAMGYQGWAQTPITVCVLKRTCTKTKSLTQSPRVASCLSLSRIWEGSQIFPALRGKVPTFRNSLLQDSWGMHLSCSSSILLWAVLSLTSQLP